MVDVRSGSLEEGGDVLVAGVGAGRDFGSSGLDVDFVAALGGYLDAAEFEGKPGQALTVPGPEGFTRLVLVGLGDDPGAETYRRAAGAGSRAAGRAETLATTLAGPADAITMGALLGAYAFTDHRSEPKPTGIDTLVLIGADENALADAEAGRIVAEGVIRARDLVNTPAGHKPPARLAAIAEEIGSATGVEVRVYDETECAEERFGGLLGVAAGAANPPRMVTLHYAPADARGFVAFVGKGIVFDSGGLSLKPAASMETMKTDMSGAAAVFGAVEAVARLGLAVRVLGITPLTENMPGGAAQRPGDVLTARNGKTIEVLNTDAEGRLVLADGLSLACEAGPDLVVDVATLTGACMVALGDKVAGLMGTGDGPAAVAAAAEAAGERVWELPLLDDYRKLIDSDVADMKNTGGRYGGAITAALLLKEFVADGVSWAHLDIAGPARSTEVEHYVPKGGTGFGVRTLVEVARRMSVS
ncbi:MAG TPA: leucyl aminopeptidase [Acidimicrobiia bacterium]|nr:leucyl aminopeptidase [Acidimicrobiia bacterium]